MCSGPATNSIHDVVPLTWKSDFLNKKIIDITYAQLRDLFNRLLMVLGLAETLRPYSLRLGKSGHTGDLERGVSAVTDA